MINTRRKMTDFSRWAACLAFIILPLVSPADAQTDTQTDALTKGQPKQSANKRAWHQWGQWRGPLGTGEAPTANPPIRWSIQENIRWKAELPGEGASTPIVWNDNVFVLAATPTGKAIEPPPVDPRNRTKPPAEIYDYQVICLDRNSGKIKWQQTSASAGPHEGRHPTHTYAGGSPCTDGKRLIVSFASRGIFSYDLSGQLQWQRHLGTMRTRRGWGEAVTPVLYKDRVIVNWDHEGDSYLYSLDAATGATIWRKERAGEVTSWNTPLCTPTAEGDLIIVNGTGAARAYDFQTGAERWRCGGQTVNAIPSPIRVGDSVVCMSGYGGQTARCVPLLAKGDVTHAEETLTWRYDRDTPYVPSPTLYRKHLYFTKTNDSILTVLDAVTGKVRHAARRLPGLRGIYASPLAADGRLYIADRDGATLVLDADTLAILATNMLPAGVDASPVAVGNQLFLRTKSSLYCMQDQE